MAKTVKDKVKRKTSLNHPPSAKQREAMKKSASNKALAKTASTKKREATLQPHEDSVPVKKKSSSQKTPAKTTSPKKTAAKRKSPQTLIDKTPPSKARKQQQASDTPETHEATPSTGGSGTSKTSVIRRIFGEQLKFSNSPPDGKGHAKGKKASTHTKKKSKPCNDTTEEESKRMTTDAKRKSRARKGNRNAKPKAPADASKARSKSLHRIQAHQVGWLTSSGVRKALSVNHPELDLEGEDYEGLLDLLLVDFAPSKIGTAYVQFAPQCNVDAEDIDLDKDFMSKPKATKLFKDMLINRHNMILQQNTIEVHSSGDEGSEQGSTSK